MITAIFSSLLIPPVRFHHVQFRMYSDSVAFYRSVSLWCVACMYTGGLLRDLVSVAIGRKGGRGMREMCSLTHCQCLRCDRRLVPLNAEEAVLREEMQLETLV